MRCWIVTEGMAGTENQCLGVAEALGIMPDVKRVRLRQPWKALSPWLGLEMPWTFTGDALAPPWPDLLLASGRKAIAAARYIKRQNPKTFAVFIQDPRINPATFDLVAIPAHDKTRGANVLVTTGAPNRVTPNRLHDAGMDWRATFDRLPRPRVAVLIGGNSKIHSLTPEAAREIANSLLDLARRGYSLEVTLSRRTGSDAENILRAVLTHTNIWLWNGGGPSPILGILDNADFIIVTSDSVSMISEAATTGKPVYILNLPGQSDKFDSLYRRLTDLGAIRVFKGDIDLFEYTPLNDARLVADEIRKRMP